MWIIGGYPSNGRSNRHGASMRRALLTAAVVVLLAAVLAVAVMWLLADPVTGLRNRL